jgi:hypothetical protein
MPSILFILSYSFYIFPVELKDIYNLLEAFKIFPIINVLLFLQIGILIRNIWQKTIPKNKKWEWTLILLFLFPPFSVLYYIWVQEDKFN